MRLYRDADDDGQVIAGDTLLTTETAAADGTYSLEVSSKGDSVLNVDLTSLAAGHFMTTDNVETASFTSMGFPTRAMTSAGSLPRSSRSRKKSIRR